MVGSTRIGIMLGGSALVLAAMLPGCKVGPDYRPPNIYTPSHFSEEASVTRPSSRSSTQPGYNASRPSAMDIVVPDYQRWWTTFNDPVLNSLIVRASRQNLDVISAYARIRQARAQRGFSEGGFFPDVNTVGQYSHSRRSGNLSGGGSSVNGTTINNGSGGTGGTGGGTGTGTGSGGSTVGTTSGASSGSSVSDFWQAGFDASWEIDLFGGVARTVESADYSLAAAVEDKRNVMITTMAEVATNYVDLRGAQRRLKIAQDNVKNQREVLTLTRRKADGGLIPYLDVAQQEATVATTAASIPSLEAEIRKDIHEIAFLLGQDPGSLSAELTPSAAIPTGPLQVPPGVPSELLRRRPDVREAEMQLAAATANIGVATADLFPKVSLTGSLGLESSNFSKLFNYSSRYYSVGPSVVWNVFDAGQIHYNIEITNALAAAAMANYQKTVLQSFLDVDNALVAYNREQQRMTSLRESRDANKRAYDLSYELFQKGSKDYTSVLLAQQNYFTSQDTEITSEAQVSSDLVALYKALGGGWTIDELPAPNQAPTTRP